MGGKKLPRNCFLKKECVYVSICVCNGDGVLYGNLPHK